MNVFRQHEVATEMS